jgi:hypothetical protein
MKIALWQRDMIVGLNDEQNALSHDAKKKKSRDY